jgi:hypothetical protein
MKYRITEHQDGNNTTYFTAEYLRKGILWGESWETESTYSHPKMRIPLKFETLADAQACIKAHRWTKRIVEEGIV